MNKTIEFVLVAGLFSLLVGCGEKDTKSVSATTDAATAVTEQVAEPYPGYSELKMKADSDDVSAMYALGVKATSSEEAFLWFNKAAEKGDADAQFFIGRMHLNGVSVPANKEKAIEWFKKSAAQGNQPAKDALKRLKA